MQGVGDVPEVVHTEGDALVAARALHLILRALRPEACARSGGVPFSHCGKHLEEGVDVQASVLLAAHGGGGTHRGLEEDVGRRSLLPEVSVALLLAARVGTLGQRQTGQERGRHVPVARAGDVLCEIVLHIVHARFEEEGNAVCQSEVRLQACAETRRDFLAPAARGVVRARVGHGVEPEAALRVVATEQVVEVQQVAGLHSDRLGPAFRLLAVAGKDAGEAQGGVGCEPFPDAHLRAGSHAVVPRGGITVGHRRGACSHLDEGVAEEMAVGGHRRVGRVQVRAEPVAHTCREAGGEARLAPVVGVVQVVVGDEQLGFGKEVGVVRDGRLPVEAQAHSEGVARGAGVVDAGDFEARHAVEFRLLGRVVGGRCQGGDVEQPVAR